jgi:uncharacterized paraquat-inducible protein A
MESTTMTGWWRCTDCDGLAELPAPDAGGLQVACPDCTGAMAEEWRWDLAA